MTRQEERWNIATQIKICVNGVSVHLHTRAKPWHFV